MGVEYALVDDEARTYIHLGKKIHDAAGAVGYQIHDEKIARFLAGSQSGSFRLVADAGDEFDYLEDEANGYERLDIWWEDFVSRRGGSPEQGGASHADARLISAAPALLAACLKLKSIVETHREMGRDASIQEGSALMDEVESAVAEATGAPPE